MRFSASAILVALAAAGQTAGPIDPVSIDKESAVRVVGMAGNFPIHGRTLFSRNGFSVVDLG